MATEVMLPLGLSAIDAPSPNHGPPWPERRVRAIVWHIAEGSLEGTLSWLRSPRSQASANYVVARDGQLYRLVADYVTPWTNGHTCRPDESNPIIKDVLTRGQDPNTRSLTIEAVGYSTHGAGGSLTHVQARALIALTAAMCVRHRLVADRTHILGHYQWDGCTRRHCPGYSAWEWVDWVRQVAAIARNARGW